MAVSAMVLCAPTLTGPSVAQEPDAPPKAPVTATEVPVADVAPGCCTLPPLTPVQLEIRSAISSKLNKVGEHFPIRLASPIALGNGLQVPAGVEGSGDVVHAAKSGFGGRPGELILAVRYLDFGGIRIPLRSLSYVRGRGDAHSDTAAALMIAGGAAGSVIAMFITGGEVNIPEGTIVYAKTAAPVVLPPPTAAATATPTQQGIPVQ